MPLRYLPLLFSLLLCTCDRAQYVAPSPVRPGLTNGDVDQTTFTVSPTGVTHARDTTNLFRIDPLAPYKPSPTNYPLIFLKSGELAIATDDRNNRYRVFRWSGNSLTDGREESVFAVNHQQIRGPARMPLKVLLPGDKQTVYARTFDKIVLQTGTGPLPISERSGVWQSLTLLGGDGGPGTRLLAGNWGRNSGFGSPSPDAPLRLYVSDVNNDGSGETLLTYFREGEEWLVAPELVYDHFPGLVTASGKSRKTLINTPFPEVFPETDRPSAPVTSLDHVLLTRQNGGDWLVETLPAAAQITTVNTALEVPRGILLGGNKTEVQNYVGPQTAAALQLWKPDGAVVKIDLGGARNAAEVRQLVRLDETHVLLLIAGGEHLVLGW